MKVEIKNRFTGNVIFTYEGANLRGANLIGANLRGANLEDANLIGANLIGANLEGANLEGANLRGANLRGANLIGANLRDANLRDANLRGANLRGANLRDANLRDAIKAPMYCKWSHGITKGNLIHIGCEKRTIEEWDKFFESNETLSTERNTPEFKQIEAVYLAYKAYLTHLS